MTKTNKTHALVLIAVLIITSLGTSATAHAQGWRSKLDNLLGKDESATTTESITETVSNLTVLSDEDLVKAFKEALEVGSERVVTQLSAMNGFNNDETIHIPLPASLDKAKSVLARIGQEDIAEDLELKLNRAAEAAVPQAKELFIAAVKSMSFEDIKAIYQGSNDSATQYFKEKTSAQLSEKMRPIVDSSLADVGALATYDQFTKDYQKIPFVPDLKANLNDYVPEKGMDGIFHYLAKEEAAIRENPVKRTTELLQRVFSK